jgi:Protein of unknown function (DUF2927)
MWKSGAFAILAAAVSAPCLAQASTFDKRMDTLWEVLWHQSGTATRLVRWEQDIKVRMHGVDAAAHKQHTLQALRDVAAEAGVQVVDVSDRPDAEQQANLSIEITQDSALEDKQPCVTRLNFQSESAIDSVTLQMRGSDARRCAYHEAMHVMGVRGHPQGPTVLSYFERHHDGLLPLDKAMLRAWYSPHMRGGMTPFEVLPVLADQLVALLPDRKSATLARDRYLARTVGEMQAFANGAGDVPMIVKRCGKTSEMGIRYGRMEMSYFLGVAYKQGATVKQDASAAQQWLQRAASLGSRSAQARLDAGSISTSG